MSEAQKLEKQPEVAEEEIQFETNEEVNQEFDKINE